MRGPGVGRPGVGRAHRPHAGADCAAPEIAAGDSGADAGLRLPRGRYWFNGGYFQLGRAHIRGWRDLDLCKRGRCCIRLAVAALPVRDRGPRSGVDYQKTGHRSREAEHSVAVPIRRTERSSRPYARTGNGKDTPVAGWSGPIFTMCCRRRADREWGRTGDVSLQTCRNSSTSLETSCYCGGSSSPRDALATLGDAHAHSAVVANVGRRTFSECAARTG